MLNYHPPAVPPSTQVELREFSLFPGEQRPAAAIVANAAPEAIARKPLPSSNSTLLPLPQRFSWFPWPLKPRPRRRLRWVCLKPSAIPKPPCPPRLAIAPSLEIDCPGAAGRATGIFAAGRTANP
ncbi:MAG: hypothetical protein HC890_01140 [Chloroflexaceae bacterium]|nr:hypothetical protein [Chloroflexaceae bacterium]